MNQTYTTFTDASGKVPSFHFVSPMKLFLLRVGSGCQLLVLTAAKIRVISFILEILIYIHVSCRFLSGNLLSCFYNPTWLKVKVAKLMLGYTCIAICSMTSVSKMTVAGYEEKKNTTTLLL